VRKKVGGERGESDQTASAQTHLAWYNAKDLMGVQPLS